MLLLFAEIAVPGYRWGSYTWIETLRETSLNKDTSASCSLPFSKGREETMHPGDDVENKTTSSFS